MLAQFSAQQKPSLQKPLWHSGQMFEPTQFTALHAVPEDDFGTQVPALHQCVDKQGAVALHDVGHACVLPHA